MRLPWISRKKHEAELEAIKRREADRANHRIANLEQKHAEKRKELSDLMEKLEVWRIEHGWGPPRGQGGYRYYRVMTEFSFEMMHGIVGGAPHFARMVAEDLRDRVYQSLIALCHIDQPPPKFDPHRGKLPLNLGREDG